ncbi:hypothetical protein ACFLUK_03005 [Chloroflexota bacterium]
MSDKVESEVRYVRKVILPVLEPRNLALEKRRKEGAKLAPRLSSLEGATIGILNNRKHLCAWARPQVEQILKDKKVKDFFVEEMAASNKPPEEALERLAKADAVILMTAD